VPLWLRRTLLAAAVACFLAQLVFGIPYVVVDLGLALGFASTWQ
jgi:hypothetical protein